MLNRFVSKDRKVLRKIDKDAAKQSMQGVVGSLFVFVIVAVGVDLFTITPSLAVAMSIALTVSSFARLILIFRFEKIYPTGPKRWRKMFSVALLSHAVIWSAFLLSLLWIFSLSSYFFIVSLYT